jgi:MRG-binding protein
LLESRTESTVADTDEAASSPAPRRRGGRATRRAGRISKLQQEVGRSRKTSSKAASATEDDRMDDAEQDDGEDDEGSDAVDENEADGPPKSRASTRGRGTMKGRGGRGRGSTRSRGRRK